jgi:hypothetical protein
MHRHRNSRGRFTRRRTSRSYRRRSSGRRRSYSSHGGGSGGGMKPLFLVGLAVGGYLLYSKFGSIKAPGAVAPMQSAAQAANNASQGLTYNDPQFGMQEDASPSNQG